MLVSHCSLQSASNTPYLGQLATVDFENAPEQLANSKYLNRQVMAGPNFAWRYSIAYMSCGLDCRENVVVNSVNGSIISTFVSCGKPDFQLESNLLNVRAKSATDHCKAEKYRLVDDELLIID